MDRELAAEGEGLSARAWIVLGVVVTLSFAALVAFGARVHEPWWDEAQAWLIARDASIAELFFDRLAYEGHPPLWYLLLAIPAKLGLPYKTMHIIAALIAIAGVAILQCQRRVPVVIRVLLPFTFYFAYQYTVVARSYVLLGALLIAVAALYDRRTEHFWTFVALLIAIAHVSIHGVGIAGALALLFAFDEWRNRRRGTPAIRLRRLLLAGALLAANVAALAVITWPPEDMATRFNVGRAFRPSELLTIPADVSIETLFGFDTFIAIIASQLTVLLFLWWFWKTRTLALFALMTVSILVPCAIYFSPWHEGIFFLILMTAMLVSFGRASNRRLRLIVTSVLALVLLRHVYWTAASYTYDATSHVTGSRDAAEYIRSHGIDRARLFGAGMRCIELQPYFEHNVFANYTGPHGVSYWNWAEGNPWPYPGRGWFERERERWMRSQLVLQPDYVLVANGFNADIMFSAIMSKRSDYRREAIFRGGLFWKDHVIETITFQLYRRVQ